MFYRALNTPLFYTSRSFPFNLLYMKDKNKNLLNKTVEHVQFKISTEKMLTSITVANTLVFMRNPQI